MAELKTKQNNKSVTEFLKSIPDPQKRKDCLIINNLLKKITKTKPKMWGDAIIGYGSYRYKYESGRELDWFPIGFSPRKNNITLYTMCGFEKNAGLMKELGKYKTGKSCLYINKLEDVDLKTLEEIFTNAFKSQMAKG